LISTIQIKTGHIDAAYIGWRAQVLNAIQAMLGKVSTAYKDGLYTTNDICFPVQC